MLIYILNLISIPIYNKFIKNKKCFCFVVILQLFLILAMTADTMGIDNSNYIPGFEYISSLEFKDMLSRLHLFSRAELIYPFAYESGWVIFNWLVSFFGGDFHTLMVINSLICMISIGYFIYKNSDCSWLSFVIYTSFAGYTFCFGVFRHVLMIAILLFAFEFAKERKFISTALLIFLAFTIHMTAIMFVLIFFVVKYPINKKSLIIYFTICGIILLVGPILLPKVIQRLYYIMGRGFYEISTKYVYNNFIILLILITCFSLLFASKSLLIPYEKDNIIFSTFILSIIFSELSMLTDVISRPNQMFYIMMVPLIPNVISAQKNRQTRIIAKSVVYILMFGFMVISLHNDPILVPYKFFFMK